MLAKIARNAIPVGRRLPGRPYTNAAAGGRFHENNSKQRNVEEEKCSLIIPIIKEYLRIS